MRRVRITSALTIVLGFLISFVILAGCGPTSKPSNGPPDPPKPPEYDHTEQEPNDELGIAQLLSVLPETNPENLIGSFSPPVDHDCYAFFLDLPAGVTSTLFNFTLDSDISINPKVKLWQTVVDEQGIFTGYQNLGTWVASDGMLVVLNEEVPYDEFYNNDLIMEIVPWGGPADPPPNIDLTYTLEFWSN